MAHNKTLYNHHITGTRKIEQLILTGTNPIPLDTTCALEFDTVIRFNHMYKEGWQSSKRQLVQCHTDKQKRVGASLHDKHAIGVYRWIGKTDGKQVQTLVGHLPNEMSLACNGFLNLDGSEINAIVTEEKCPDEKGVTTKGYVVPARFKATSTHTRCKKIIKTLSDELHMIIEKDPKLTLRIVQC